MTTYQVQVHGSEPHPLQHTSEEMACRSARALAHKLSRPVTVSRFDAEGATVVATYGEQLEGGDKRRPETVGRWMVVRAKDRDALVALLPPDWRVVFDATPTPDGWQDFVVECVEVGSDTLERVQRRLSMHDMFGREFRDRDQAFESASAAMN